jgi:hypothetical protein
MTYVARTSTPVGCRELIGPPVSMFRGSAGLAKEQFGKSWSGEILYIVIEDGRTKEARAFPEEKGVFQCGTTYPVMRGHVEYDTAIHIYHTGSIKSTPRECYQAQP